MASSRPKLRRRSNCIDIGTIALDRGSSRSLNDQLAEAISEAILAGRFPPGAKLPSTRLLAEELGVSRTTTSAVFEGLAAEGLIETIIGSGTRVSTSLPVDFVAPGPRSTPEASPFLGSRLSTGSAKRLAKFVRNRYAGIPRPFSPGVPGIDQFPITHWTNLVGQRWRGATIGELCRPHEAGTRELCAAVAQHVSSSRGAICEASSILIVSSTQQALTIAASVLTDPGDICWIEDPGYSSARYALTMAGLTLIPAAVDSGGMDVEAAIRNLPPPRLIYLTPSHQYPMGGTLSLDRRQAVLEYAEKVGAWVIEDDYDSEYSSAGAPVLCLQGLDTHERVIYTSSFNKTMFPTLRLGFMIVPRDLKEAFEISQTYSDGPPPAVTQSILAEFINSGAFVSHLRRTRTVYAQRRRSLVDALARFLPELTLGVHDRGLHFVALLPDNVDDEAAVAIAQGVGIFVLPLSRFYLGEARRRGLLFGFACVPEIQIEPAVRRLAVALGPMLTERHGPY